MQQGGSRLLFLGGHCLAKDLFFTAEPAEQTLELKIVTERM